jgi:hypothetical protein
MVKHIQMMKIDKWSLYRMEHEFKVIKATSKKMHMLSASCSDNLKAQAYP